MNADDPLLVVLHTVIADTIADHADALRRAYAPHLTADEWHDLCAGLGHPLMVEGGALIICGCGTAQLLPRDDDPLRFVLWANA